MSQDTNTSPRKAHGEYHKLTDEELREKLDTNFQTGLHEKEVSVRREKYGPNELEEEEKESFWDKIKEQFEDRMVRLLLLAAAISFVVSLTST